MGPKLATIQTEIGSHDNKGCIRKIISYLNIVFFQSF